MELFNGLSHYYKFDDADVVGYLPPAHDEVSGDDGVYFLLLPDDGVIGLAVKHGGSYGRLTFPPYNNGTKTISFWAKTIEEKDISILGNIYPDVRADFWVIGLDSDGYLYAEGAETVAGDFPKISTTKKINDGKWYHIALVLDKDTQTGTLYVNGNEEGKNTNVSAELSMFNYQSYSFLNFEVGGAESHYAGSLDELGIWDRALSKREVEILYNQGHGLTYPALPLQIISKTIYYNKTNITQARAEIVFENKLNYKIYLSNDDGLTWEEVQDGATHTFTSVGQKLRYKLTADPGTIINKIIITKL